MNQQMSSTQQKIQLSRSTKLRLDPFPNGWFNVGHINKFKTGQIYSQKFFGEDIIIFKTSKGNMVVMDAYCPHLGSHLGRDDTGRPRELKNDCVECVFHKYTFNEHGDCVQGEAKVTPSKTAKVFTWPVEVVYGLVFVYFDKNKLAPTWKISDYWLVTDDWSPLYNNFNGEYPVHPQDVQENAADRLHFYTLHGMTTVKQAIQHSTNGAHFKQTLVLGGYYPTKPSMFLVRLLISMFKLDDPFVETNVIGLGLGLAKNSFEKYGICINHLITATPIDANSTALRFYVQTSFKNIKLPIPRFLKGKFRNTGSKIIKFYERILTYLILGRIFKFVQGQDIDAWSHRSFIPDPALVAEDGPIHVYRKWSKQFYPDKAEVVDIASGHDRQSANVENLV